MRRAASPHVRGNCGRCPVSESHSRELTEAWFEKAAPIGAIIAPIVRLEPPGPNQWQQVEGALAPRLADRVGHGSATSTPRFLRRRCGVFRGLVLKLRIDLAADENDYHRDPQPHHEANAGAERAIGFRPRLDYQAS
jgi:hypothetical protein